MNPLSLSPLPSPRSQDEPGSLLMEQEGFVDEEVVRALVTGPTISRTLPCPKDLVLSVDDHDFAGWQLAPARTTRAAEVPPQVIDAIVRRALPPVIDEPGIGSAHRGSHRWWLAGLAGVLSTMLFSLLLLSLSARNGMELAPAPSPLVLSPKPVAKSEPAPVSPLSPALSDATRTRP